MLRIPRGVWKLSGVTRKEDREQCVKHFTRKRRCRAWLGIVIGVACCLMLGVPHLPRKLWPEEVKPAVYSCGVGLPQTYLKARRLLLWMNKLSGGLEHMHKFGSITFKHIEERHGKNKLALRAQALIMMRYNTKDKTSRLRTPERSHKIQNSAEVSFQEKDTPDVFN